MKAFGFDLRCIIAAHLLIFLFVAVPASAQEPANYKNLQVLPPDTTRDELGDAMLRNTLGLGLPRRQREGCLFCHVGSMDLPVSEWDFAADDKPEKETARAMMRMVQEINDHHLANLDVRIDPAFEVDCATCHAGRTDPRPLHVIFDEVWTQDGIDSAVENYRELYHRYRDAGAYDFRPTALIRIAVDVSRKGAWDDALTIMRLNEEIYPDLPLTSRARLTMQVERKLAESGVAAALAFFDRARIGERADVVDTSILDGVGWRLHRRDSIDDALVVFRRNLELFPDAYIPNESLADALWFSGSREEGMAVLQRWVSANPDNEMGRRRLLNMQDELADANLRR